MSISGGYFLLLCVVMKEIRRPAERARKETGNMDPEVPEYMQKLSNGPGHSVHEYY
jgi:hypothetical protein